MNAWPDIETKEDPDTPRYVCRYVGDVPHYYALINGKNLPISEHEYQRAFASGAVVDVEVQE